MTLWKIYSTVIVFLVYGTVEIFWPKKNWSRQAHEKKNEQTLFTFCILLGKSSIFLLAFFRLSCSKYVMCIPSSITFTHHTHPFESHVWIHFFRQHNSPSTECWTHKINFVAAFLSLLFHLFNCQHFALLLYRATRIVIVNSCVVELNKFIHCDFSNLI